MIPTLREEDKLVPGATHRRVLAELERCRAEVNHLCVGIRKHRDQREDDRCWMDDMELYALLPEGLDSKFVDLRQLPREEMMKNCDRFTRLRCTDLAPEDAIAAYKAGRR